MGAHLRHLVAASLLAYEEEKRPLGRPARRYRLTPQADALFTKHYELLAVKMTEALSRMGPTSLDEILARWVAELVGYFDARLPGEGAARLAALAEHQSRFGFMASIERGPDGPVLLERNCPIAVVASRFPRICDQEAALFASVLRRGVGLSTCQARGDSVCSFRIARVAP
jgi:predicted ArsR family transcriptional regulator